jgi:uncharacterized membrane protein
MTVFLSRLATVAVWVLIVDGLIVAFLAGSYAVTRFWDRRRPVEPEQVEWRDVALWNAEIAESAREAAKRWHPAGGRDLS